VSLSTVGDPAFICQVTVVRLAFIRLPYSLTIHRILVNVNKILLKFNKFLLFSCVVCCATLQTTDDVAQVFYAFQDYREVLLYSKVCI